MLVALAAEMRHVHTVKRLLTFRWEKIGSEEIKARKLRFIFAKNQGKIGGTFYERGDLWGPVHKDHRNNLLYLLECGFKQTMN